MVRLRKKSISQYLKNKCTVTKCNKSFWDAVKPLISDKCKGGQEHIILSEDDAIINEPSYVCNIFNEFYNTVAADFGQKPADITNCQNDEDFDVYMNDVLQRYSTHASVLQIRDNVHFMDKFSFSKVSLASIQKRLCKLKTRKATGYDGVPPKLLKAGASALCYPLHYLVNKCIELSLFPSALKRAEIMPLYKKGDNLKKENYRPVSVLSCVSKIFEGVIVDQLSQYFEAHLSEYVSGFRKGHDCQSVLFRFNECIKSHLDNNQVAGAVLTDLSKAFDCLPHDLLLCKLYYYGVDKSSCKLVASYFKDRYHRVKLGSAKSDWLLLMKGAPQGSMFGPFSYNVHSNDLIMLVARLCDIFNYADDNTICCYGNNINEVKHDLENVITQMNNWFSINEMKVNNIKFQMIAFTKDGVNSDESIIIDNNVIQSQRAVKLLGVNFDSALSFNVHVNEICRKAGRKMNVLGRLSRSLDLDSKLMLFHSFVLSHFEYCAVVWHFCSKDNMKKIEKIQKQALRYVFNDYTSSYANLRGKANRPLMYVQRLRSILTEVSKCLNKTGPQYLHDMFSLNEGSRNSRKGSQLIQKKFNTIRYGYNSVQYQGSKMWNLLNISFKSSQCFVEWEPLCNCSHCDLCILKQM